jgi:two-component system cell cycle response regulator
MSGGHLEQRSKAVTTRRRRPTREIDIEALALDDHDDLDDGTDPPTAVTNLAELMNMSATEEHWTLTILNGSAAGLVIPIDDKPTVIGRGSECDTRILDQGLSRKHGSFYQRDGSLYFRDFESTNGSFLEQDAVSGEVKLTNGARLQLGRTLLRAHLRSSTEVEAVRKLYESSVRDGLTGLYNRRHLDERINAEFAFAARHRTALSCLVLDIDHFKKVNDTWGHAGGDAVLKRFADFCLEAVRTEDVVARYGGEEIVILLRGVGSQGAEVLAQRIRAGIERMTTSHDGKEIKITASIGVSTWEPTRPHADAQALFNAADECLYRAKNAGRNLVICDSSPRSVPPC